MASDSVWPITDPAVADHAINYTTIMKDSVKDFNH